MGNKKNQAARVPKNDKPAPSRSRSDIITLFKRDSPVSNGKEAFETVGLIVRMKFRDDFDAVQKILGVNLVGGPSDTIRNKSHLATVSETSTTTATKTATKTTTKRIQSGVQASLEETEYSEAVQMARGVTPVEIEGDSTLFGNAAIAKSPTPPEVLSKQGKDGTTLSAPPSSRVKTVNSTSISPFICQWKDETYDFNMNKIVSNLRPKTQVRDPMPVTFNWFPEATPVDAIFPPGVPMTAKEINAFYPHHIRWKGVQLRLAKNGYRGSEIVAIQAWFRGVTNPAITGVQINQFLRDSLRSKDLAKFKTSEGAFKGKPDRNLNTGHLDPSRYIEEKCGGLVAPTFEELLKGVKFLPSGADARGLTHCLAWWLKHRDMFSPRLEFNVLHVQSLIRVLKLPLKGYGPQNLDMNALEEWKENGKFAEIKVEDEKKEYVIQKQGNEEAKKPKMELKVLGENLQVKVSLQLCHILTFPFLAMIGMAAEGLKVGIEKVQNRRGIIEKLPNTEEIAHPALEESQPPTGTELLKAAALSEDTSTNNPSPPAEIPLNEDSNSSNPKSMTDLFCGYRIPKRSYTEISDSHPSKRLTFDTSLNIPTGPRSMSISQRQPQHHVSRRPIYPHKAETWEAGNQTTQNEDHRCAFNSYQSSQYTRR